MSLVGKSLDQITEADLQGLVDNKTSEDKSLEYKRDLPNNTDDAKKKFLKAVSSFANASGGYLFYGVEAKEGMPQEPLGISVPNADAEVLRLQDMIRDGVKPRVTPEVSIRCISLQNGNGVIALRIPKSWNSPHMVTHNKDFRFYSRSSNGAYPLDVDELRIAFELSTTVSERIKNFRLDRLSKIIAGETPLGKVQAAVLTLHLIPVSSFASPVNYDLAALLNQSRPILIPMGSPRGWDNFYNFDGVAAIRCNDKSPSYNSYTQVFRNGITESACFIGLKNQTGENIIGSFSYEKATLQSLSECLELQKHLGIQPPILVMFSLLHVSGYQLHISEFSYSRNNVPIDRDSLIIPEVLIDDFNCNTGKVMKPAFDMVWNAAGHEGSMNYDEKDNWTNKPFSSS